MEVCSIWSGYSPYLSLTERGSIHRVYCETCKADSQHEVPGATERFHAFFEKYAPGESLRERGFSSRRAARRAIALKVRMHFAGPHQACEPAGSAPPRPPPRSARAD